MRSKMPCKSDASVCPSVVFKVVRIALKSDDEVPMTALRVRIKTDPMASNAPKPKFCARYYISGTTGRRVKRTWKP